MINNPHNLQVGQKLYRVSNQRSMNNLIVEITKIGRKWATINIGWATERVSLVDLSVDGGEFMSPAQCYLSVQEYADMVKRREVWMSFKERLSYTAPKHLTLADIEKITSMVFPKGDDADAERD